MTQVQIQPGYRRFSSVKGIVEPVAMLAKLGEQALQFADQARPDRR
jgi:hypothetical protein